MARVVVKERNIICWQTHTYFHTSNATSHTTY